MRNQFGFEAEFFGLPAYAAVDWLQREAKVQVEDDGYHHDTKPYWRVTTDSSVTAMGTEHDEGNELVSPILVPIGFTKPLVKRVLDTLRNHGAQIDSSCGLHVHLDASGIEPKQALNIVETYGLFQPQVKELLPTSRHGNGYCPVYTYGELSKYEVPRGYGDRTEYLVNSMGRAAVNLHSIQDHGTIEFRQHSGTLNGDKVWGWTHLMKRFMLVGDPTPAVEEYGGEDAFMRDQTFESMLQYLGASDTLATWCWARRDEIARNTDAEDTQATSRTDWDDYEREDADYGEGDYEPYEGPTFSEIDPSDGWSNLPATYADLTAQRALRDEVARQLATAPEYRSCEHCFHQEDVSGPRWVRCCNCDYLERDHR